MTIDEQRNIYLQYLQMKIIQRDWHGVADCAMDLRELEVMQQFAGKDEQIRHLQTFSTQQVEIRRSLEKELDRANEAIERLSEEP